MATATTTTKGKTGILESLVDTAQEDVGEAYKKRKEADRTIGRDIAKLSDQQRKALGLLEGGAVTQQFKGQLGGTVGGIATGQGILSDIATGKSRLTPEQIQATTQQFLKAPGIQDQLAAVDTTAQQNIANLQSSVQQQLQEGALPSIYRQAANTGNVGSSRAAVAEGIARRGAQESMSKGAQNILSSAALQKAGLRGKAYDQALATSLGLTGQQRAEQIGAAKDVAGMGLEAGKTGASLDQQALQNLMAGGALEQAQRQGESDEQYRRRMADQNKKMQDVSEYIKMLNQLRGITDTTTQQTQYSQEPSTSDILRGAGIPVALGLGAKWLESKF